MAGDFVWDDSGLIAENAEYLENLANVKSLLLKSKFDAPYYRPLLWTSFLFDYYVWGLNPLGFHVTNVILHAINTILVYFFIRSLGFLNNVAFFTAILFSTHPVQTEAIAWIAGRNDPLMVLFLLLSFIFLFNGRQLSSCEAKVLFFAVSFATSFCAFLTKETALVLLPLLILCDLFYRKKVWQSSKAFETVVVYSSFIAISLIFFMIRNIALADLLTRLTVQYGNVSKAITTPLAIFCYYFKVLFYPVNLTVGPALIKVAMLKSKIFFLTLPMLCLAAGVLLSQRVFKICLFGTLWVIIYLLPVCGFVWMGVPILEHRLYGASIGFCLVLAALCSHLSSDTSSHKKYIGYAVMGIILVSYSLVVVDRNWIWRNEFLVWNDTVKKSPTSVTALNNLGLILVKQKKYDSGIEQFKKILQLSPTKERMHNTYNNLGFAFAQKRDYKNALMAYEKALQLNPRSAKTYNNIALVFKEYGDYQQALAYFKKSLELTPLPEVYMNMAQLYAVMGDKERMLNQYQKALQLTPRNSSLHNALGLFYFREGKFEKSLEHYKEALSYNPFNFDALKNIYLLYFKMKAYEKALPFLKTALSLHPNSPELHLQLGIVFFNLKEVPKAIAEYTKALELNPTYVEAHFNIATAYLLIPGGKEKAVYHFNMVLSLRPDYEYKETIKRVIDSIKNKK